MTPENFDVTPPDPEEIEIDDDLNERIDEQIAILGNRAPSYDEIPDDIGDDDAAFLQHAAANPLHHGLNPTERIRTRRLIKFAALETVHRAVEIHYTQGPRRWEGIDKKFRCYPGHIEYPKYADCSAYVTWLYWNALKRRINHGFPDILNGANWKAGYTGTLLQHGRQLHNNTPGLVGDLVIYGAPGTTGRHVAGYIGNGMVFSHGSEAGPFILPWNYRKDVESVRRYL